MRISFTWAVAVVVMIGVLSPRSEPLAAPGSPGTVTGRTDSAVVETPPGPLIRPPRPAPATPSPDSTGADTAVASAKRRALEQYARGLGLEKVKAYAGAIVSYTNAARTDPTLRGPSFHIGLLFASRQQFDHAARAFREEMHRDPDNPDPAKYYALMLAELGDTTRPARMLEGLTRRVPEDASVWRALGFVYARLGREEKAERALRGSIALNGKDPEAWRDLGVLLAARGDAAGARDAYRRSLALAPGNVTTLINLANLESREGDHEHALAYFARAERRDTTVADAYRGEIRELLVMNREPDAGAVWRRWLARDPADHDVRESAARHFVRQGRADVALEIARDGVRRTPASGEARWLQGEMHAAAGEPLLALQSYREARARFSEPADRARAEASIARLRATAPDSLRARFVADSVANARADTARGGGRTAPRSLARPDTLR